MSVIVDQESLATDALGLGTIGQLLAHLRHGDRLVVNLLIDGEQPDLARLNEIRRSPLRGRTIFIETASARQTAIDVLDDIRSEVLAAEELKADAIEQLQNNKVAQAMVKLGGCFSAWNHAQESVLKTSQLLRLDIERLSVGGRTLSAFLTEFTAQLQQIKQALVNQDYVLLTDMLQYETTETTRHWLTVIAGLRAEAVGN